MHLYISAPLAAQTKGLSDFSVYTSFWPKVMTIWDTTLTFHVLEFDLEFGKDMVWNT